MLRAFSSLIYPVLTASVRSISNLKTASKQSTFCVRAHLQACFGKRWILPPPETNYVTSKHSQK